jgi:hypothetical protein
MYGKFQLSLRLLRLLLRLLHLHPLLRLLHLHLHLLPPPLVFVYPRRG